LNGSVQSIWRHPVKGFTPEPMRHVALTAGACFPFDRMYAVEDGPSGFDPAAPRHISKQKFTVLAKIAAVAKIHTRYDDSTGVLQAEAEGRPPIRAALDDPEGRETFAAWLAGFLGEEISGPLKVLPAPGAHRFMDDEEGFISIVNLASVRDFEARTGRAVDPRRFRANIYVEGWAPWEENRSTGRALRLGEVELEVVKPIPRCVATHVDPETGDKDIDLVPALWGAYGHRLCGVYGRVLSGGRVSVGDPASLDLPDAPALKTAAG